MPPATTRPGTATSTITWPSTAGIPTCTPVWRRAGRAARAGLRLACLTNKPTEFARPLLQAKGLDAYFEVVFGGDAFERKKPDPLPLLKTCEALGTLPARTLMVGDSSNDARAARAAGCPVVLVTYGYNHGEPVRAVDADGFVDSLAELV
jgi:phosphoglycolate phosphatase